MRQRIEFCVRAYNLFTGKKYGVGKKISMYSLQICLTTDNKVFQRKKTNIIDYSIYPGENLELLTCTKSNREKT